MASQQSGVFEDAVLDKLESDTNDVLTRITQQAGPPPDAERMSEADEDQAWDFVDPNADHEQLASMLATQGIPPEVGQNLLAFKLHPEWAPFYGKPTNDMQLADQYARMLTTPFRWSILEDFDDPDEMVKKAESMDRRSQKRLTQMQEYQAVAQTRPASYGQGGY